MEHIGKILKEITPAGSEKVSADRLPEQIHKCPICRDSGWVHPWKKLENDLHIIDFGMTVPCQCQVDKINQRKKEAILRYCELPTGKESENMTFEKFIVKDSLQEAYEAAMEVATGKLQWLTLMAKTDRGKTHLAIAICRYKLEHGDPARYIYVPLLLDELREGYNKEDYQSRFQQFLDVPLLVLDDLGVQKPTLWAMEKLNTIIDYRCINGKSLVITTNKPLDELPGDDECRIASRLQRVRSGKVVVIDAPEFRLSNNIK